MTTRAGDDGPASLDAFRAGDETALAELYARWSPLVYSLALRSLGDVGAAEDVTRRVFTRVWTEREAFDPGRHRFSTWLVDQCRGIIAEARVGAAGPTPAGGPVRTATAPAGEEDPVPGESRRGGLAERLLMADELAHLDTTSREVLHLALDEDLSHTEIARRTGMSVEDVKGLIASGLVELRSRLEVGAHAHES